MKKALKVKTVWMNEFEVGLVRIEQQTFRGDAFGVERGKAHFVSSEGYMLESLTCPDYEANRFWVRGDEKSLDFSTVIFPSSIELRMMLRAVDEYNQAKHKVVLIDYIKLHKLLWMKLADSGSLNKAEACSEVMREEGIMYPPAHDCFLCQDTATISRHGVDCNLCKGFWGRNGISCQGTGSYYQMWCNENSPALRKALALRIANNIKIACDYTVQPNELQAALHEGKIPAIKLHKARTNMGLRKSKEAIEEAMENYYSQKEV